MDNDFSSKTIYSCKFCQKKIYAHQFANDLNDQPVRDLRLICYDCAPEFNKQNAQLKQTFIREHINSFYGTKQYVYALCEPKSEKVRYIGRSSDAKRRFLAHLQSGRTFSTEVCGLTKVIKSKCDCNAHKLFRKTPSTKKWISKLFEKNQKPVMKIIEEVEPGYLIAEREIRHICQHIRDGSDLLNFENQSKEIRELLRSHDTCFMIAEMEHLKSSGFLKKFQRSLTGTASHESGWRRAVLLQRIFSANADLAFEERNYGNMVFHKEKLQV